MNGEYKPVLHINRIIDGAKTTRLDAQNNAEGTEKRVESIINLHEIVFLEFGIVHCLCLFKPAFIKASFFPTLEINHITELPWDSPEVRVLNAQNDAILVWAARVQIDEASLYQIVFFEFEVFLVGHFLNLENF